MALSESDKQEILEMIRQENSQKQKKIMSSKSNFKSWLRSAAKSLVNHLTDYLIEKLFDWLYSLLPF